MSNVHKGQVLGHWQLFHRQIVGLWDSFHDLFIVQDDWGCCTRFQWRKLRLVLFTLMTKMLSANILCAKGENGRFDRSFGKKKKLKKCFLLPKKQLRLRNCQRGADCLHDGKSKIADMRLITKSLKHCSHSSTCFNRRPRRAGRGTLCRRKGHQSILKSNTSRGSPSLEPAQWSYPWRSSISWETEETVLKKWMEWKNWNGGGRMG